MPKTSVLISSLAAVAAVGGLMFWMLPAHDSPPPVEIVPESASTDATLDNNDNAIANKWQWENFPETKSVPKSDGDSKNAKENQPSSTDEVTYDVVGIYNVLQSIQLTEAGRVVPDQTAKQALEQGFVDLGPDLSPQAMAELQDLIRIGLPGEAGEDAARIVKDYYQFRLAEEEFNQYLPKDGELPTGDRYEELVQLRRTYLGEEVANQLFAVEDTQARHMLAAIALQQNTELTDEEKQVRQAALQEKLSERLLTLGQLEPEEAAAEEVRRLREQGASSADIYAAREEILGAESARELAAADREDAQWEARFNGFWQARQHVMQAGLEEDERERQIEQLLDQYFNAEDRERARDTSYEWQARDSK